MSPHNLKEDYPSTVSTLHSEKDKAIVYGATEANWGD